MADHDDDPSPGEIGQTVQVDLRSHEGPGIQSLIGGGPAVAFSRDRP